MRQARDTDIKRFPRQYEAFKQGKEEQQAGTPLSLMPWITPARVEEYKFFKIVTVEQLAQAPDEGGKNFMGFQQDKQKAQEYTWMPASAASAHKKWKTNWLRGTRSWLP